MRSDGAGVGLKVAAWGGLAFLHFPILVIFVYAFNTETSAFSFPLRASRCAGSELALGRDDVREAIALSLKIAALSHGDGGAARHHGRGRAYRRRLPGRKASR
jgi:putative spermidine/putrescine transport system permease protein